MTERQLRRVDRSARIAGAAAAATGSRGSARTGRTKWAGSGRRRSHRHYWAFAATEGEIQLPPYVPLGYLEQARLIRAAQAGDVQARNTLWLRHARLAYSVINRHRVPLAMAADAVQEAQIGILRAILRFDLERLVDFSTFAAHHIRSRITRLRGRMGQSAPVPGQLATQYMRFRHQVAEADSRSAWFDARDQWLGDDAPGYRRLIRLHAVCRPQGLWALASKSQPAAPDECDPQVGCERAEQRLALVHAVESLDERDRLILERRYGVCSGSIRTLASIGRHLGYSKERVRQLQRSAEARLRDLLYDRPPQPLAVDRVPEMRTVKRRRKRRATQRLHRSVQLTLWR